MGSPAAKSDHRSILKWIKTFVTETTVWGLGIDTLLLTAVIACLNIHLLFGTSCRSMIFIPERFFAGEWHRLLTYPFVHLTWYHFILDAGAFLLLYTGLEENRVWKRLMYAGVCGLSSLSTAWMFAPQISELGLCGLSGTAHGLMAISALEMMRRSDTFRLGLGCLSLVTIKSIYEAIAGKVVFEFLHFGLCGSPLAVCHLGGAIGGMVAFLGINASLLSASYRTRFTFSPAKGKHDNRLTEQL